MRYIVAVLTFGLVLILEGCIPSLHPLYTDNDLVFEPAILGEWVLSDSHSKEILTFTKGNEKKYKVVQADESGKNAYVGRLVKLNGKLFLDVEPDREVKCECLCPPYHMFFFVSQLEPSLRISSLDLEWTAEFLRKNPSALNHEFVREDLWLTAPTKSLQAFVLKHLNTKGAFADPNEYVRKR